MLQKNDKLRNKAGKVYEIAGKWDRDFILSPVDKGDDACLIYTEGEMKDFLESGHFQKVGMKK